MNRRLLKCALILSFLLSTFLAASAADWPPLNPTDLTLKTPKIDPDAEAEALLWDVRMSSEYDGYQINSTQFHYIRIKIFSERGRDHHSTVDIEYANHEHI